MQCDCDHMLPDTREGHYSNCSAVWDEGEMRCPCPNAAEWTPSIRLHSKARRYNMDCGFPLTNELRRPPLQMEWNPDGSMRLRNVHLKKLERDVIYHLGLDTSTDLQAAFGDVKFVCMGGTKHRMREFAGHLQRVLGSEGLGKPVNLTKRAHRYAVYKVGPVLSISHGIGIPSMSVVLQEVFKLLHYARAKDPVFFRIGTSGGLGMPPGSVVVSAFGLSGTLEKTYDIPVLGKVRKLPSIFDERLCKEVASLAATDDKYRTYVGGTMAADDYYRGQGRLDGPFCDYTEADKMAFLRTLSDLGVRNIEMEATAFAAYTREAGVRAADVCVTLIDRLQGDQVTSSPSTMMEWQTRPIELVGRFIGKHCGRTL